MEPTIGMRPGGTRTLSLGTRECCVFFEPVDACVTWSVEPGEGASISPEGELTIDPSVEGGAVYTVYADVEDGRQQVSIDVHVYDPADNPLVGTWREEAQYHCEGEGEIIPEERIAELRFFADGRINVTWTPFEVYVDYWGEYIISEEGLIEFNVTGGNYIPEDIDGTGRYVIDKDGNLNLEDIWLGSKREIEGAPNCGHRFSK